MYKIFKSKYLFFLVLGFFQASLTLGQAIDFYPAGQVADGDNIYNINSTVATNGPFSGANAGGVWVNGSSLEFTSWDVQISFDGGAFTTINGDGSNDDNAAANGQSFGSATVRPTADGDLNIWFSHAEIAATSGYPGTVDGINISFRIRKVSDGTTLPTSPQDYAFDLVAPTLTSASIASDNANTNWAKSGDNITITLTAPSGSDGENLGTADQWSTSIQGLGATVSGAGLVWTVSTTVSSHPEGPTYFQITYYDAYENPGTVLTDVIGNTDQVIIDKTPPNIAASILSNDNPNNTQYLATVGDVVTLTISATDADGGAEIIQVPEVKILGAVPTSDNLNVAASSYTATRTMQDGDAEGDVAFSIEDIADRAGNPATDVTAVTSGSNVRFDSIEPTLLTLTVVSNNSIANNKATIGDIVTISFASNLNESLQTPIVTIDGEDADEQQNGNDYTWTATKVMDAEDTERATQFSISFKDLAANNGIAQTHANITSGSLVDFDATPPTINSETASTTNSFNNTLAILGQVISIDIVSAEELYSIKDILIAGKAVPNQVTELTNVTEWTIDHEVDGTEADGYVGYSYTAVDLAGNETDVVKSSSSIRIDNSKPVLNTLTIISNNTNTSYAKIGDVVTLNIVANEALRIDPIVSIQGRTASIAAAGDGITFTATHMFDNTDTEGLVAFQVDFENTFGLAGDRIIDDGSGGTTNNGATVTFDRSAPTLNPVTVTSNNDNPLYAKVGDIVTLSFASNEPIQDPPTVVFLNTPGDNRVGAVSGSGTNWNATYTMQNSDTEGDVDFYIDFTDIAGNNGTRETSLSSGSEIIFDRDVPELSTVDISSNNANPALSKVGDVITLAITADEDIQIPSITIAGTSIANSAITGNDGEKNFTATYTMQSSDNTTAAIGFTIDFSDLANNSGAQKTTLENDGDGLNVGFDKQDPGLDLVTIFSNNSNRAGTGNKTGLAIVNDIVTVNFQSDENLKTGVNPDVLIAGNAATVIRNANNDFTATYQMASDDDTDGANIAFSISNIVDQSGNTPASAIVNTTDGSVVTFDRTNPILGSITIASNNLDNSLAIENDVVTLTFASQEDIAAPTVSILGGAAAVTNVADSMNWVATRTVGGADSEGAVGFSITYSDKAGNNGSTRTDLTGGDDPVTVDLTVPQITKASIKTNNDTGDELSVPGDIVTLDIETTEAIQTPDITIATQTAFVVQGINALTWTATYTMTTNEANGVVPFAVDFMDLAGNLGNGGASYTALLNDDDNNSVNFDKSQPELDYVHIESDNTLGAYGRVGSEVTLSFESNEALDSYSVSINGNASSVSYDAANDRYSASYTLVDGDTEGDVTFTIDFIDLNGYQGVQQTETLDGSNVEFDKTPPEMNSLIYSSDNENLTSMAKEGDVITVSINTNENIQSPTITLATNPSGTPVAGGTNAIWSSTYTVPSLADGVVALQVDFKDYAGNSGTRQIAPTSGSTVTYDGTVPTLGTVTFVSNNSYSNAKAKLFDELTLTIASDESIQTPVVTIAGTPVAPSIGVDDKNWVATYIMQESDAEIDVPFTIDFKDLADNSGIQVGATTGGEIVNYDNTAPVTTGLVVDLKDVSDTGLSDSDNITTELTPTFEIQNLTSGPASATGETLILNIDGQDYTTTTITVDDMSIAVPADNPLTNNVLPYTVTAYIRDLAGNLSLASNPLSLTVDTEAPTTNAELNLVDGSDSGSDNADNITSDNTPTLEVNGLADGEIYTVLIEYDLEGGATDQVVINTPMSQPVTDQFTTTSLSDGVYTFTYKLVDTAGNTSLESDPLVVTIDRTQPAITSAPDLVADFDKGTLNDDNLTNLANLQFSVSNLVVGENLEIYDDNGNGLLGSKTITATTETITINGFSENSHTVYARVTDLAGNQCGESGALTFIVDLTAINVANITLDLNDADDSGTLNDDNLTNITTPTFTISTVSVDDIVHLYADGILVGNATSIGNSVEVTSSLLVDNPYLMSYTLTDYAGNISEVSPNTLDIVIDTTPWGILKDLILVTDTGADAGDNVTNDQTPQFSIPSDLDFAELDLIRLYRSVSGGSTTLIHSERKLASTTAHNITVPNNFTLGEGNYNFTYDIVDYAGNVSLTTSAAITITVDVTAPLYVLNSDLDDATDSGGNTLDPTDPLTTDNLTNSTNLSITLSGFTTGDYAQLFYSYNDGLGVPVLGTVEDNALVSLVDAGSKTFSFPHIGDGEYTISGYSADLAGNQNTAVDLIVTVDTTPPDASLVELDLVDASDTGGDPSNPIDPLTTDNITNDKTPDIFIRNLSSADSVILYNNDINSSPEARGLPSATTMTLTQDFTSAADADITVYATLKDAAGNESAASPAPLVITLDTTAPLSGLTPSLPDLTDATDTGEFPSDNKTYNQNPSFFLTLTDVFKADSVILYAQTGIIKTTVGRTIKVLNEEFATISVGEGGVSAGTKLVEANDYIITYKLKDAAGNISAESSPLNSLQIDITYPDVPGDPDLVFDYDTGGSDSDNITNAANIFIDLPGIEPGLIGKLYTFADVGDDGIPGTGDVGENDGIFNYDDWGVDAIPGTSDFGENNNAYDEGEYSSESPTIVVADYNGDNSNFENWFLNDWTLSNNDEDCGCLDGILTYNYATTPNDSVAIGFFTIHEDLVGHRKQSPNALIVQADRQIPAQLATVAYSDADYLVNTATGNLRYTFSYPEELDSFVDPPTIDIRFPTSAPNLDNQPLVYTGSNNVWYYDLDLTNLGGENGLIIAQNHSARDVAGNDIASPSWTDITIDNLPAEFTQITPDTGSFNNVLDNFSWILSEDLDPLGTNVINFYQDNAIVATYQLTGGELVAGSRAAGSLGSGFSIADGIYTISFETLDIVGNVGKVDVENYSYDTKNPEVTMTYSREVVTEDSLVTVIATFDEPVTSSPVITLTAMDSLVSNSHSITAPMMLPGGCECLDNNGILIPDCDPAIDEITCTDVNGFNANWDPDYFGEIDGTTWIYHYTAPGVDDVELDITNSGPVDVWLVATDLATNNLYMVTNAVNGITSGFKNPNPLYVDNDKTTATYSYSNLTNSSIIDAAGNATNFAGAGGDIIEVTITLNQPIMTDNPVPELRYSYGSGAGTGISNVTFVSVADIEDGIDPLTVDPLTEANRIWKWNLEIPDLIEWDGAIDFNLYARDLSNVLVSDLNEIDDKSFVVDNIHPSDFQTGIVTVSGENPVQGYITGFIDEISVNVPIPTQAEDPTIINGEVKIEFFNLNRGVNWVTIGSNSVITEVGDLVFSRDLTDLYAEMVQDVDIITGDQISVRASLIDRNGNITIGSESITQMAYDPTAPVMGAITGGNFSGESSPQYSNDLINLEWSEFLESDPGESGVQKYEILIRKLADGDCDCLDQNGNIIAECEATVDYTTCVSAIEDGGFASNWTLDGIADSILIDWTQVLPPTTSFSYEPILEHNNKYRAFVRALDVAGNISTTLSSDILYRLNSAPVIEPLNAAILNEDFFWSDTLKFSDLDLNVQQGDQFTFEVITALQPGATPYLEEGIAQGGSVSEIILSQSSVPQDNFYRGNVVTLLGGVDDNVRTILDYDGTTKVATISNGLNDWNSPPTQGSEYTITGGSVSINAYTPDEGNSGIDRYAILSWKPTQVDVNSYNLSILVKDAYDFVETLPLVLTVRPINDPPVFVISQEDKIIEWREDTSSVSPTTLNLSQYIYDVDNNVTGDCDCLDQNGNIIAECEATVDSTTCVSAIEDGGFASNWTLSEIDWIAVVKDTSQLDEDYPYGQVFVKPGISKIIHAKVLKENIGFDIHNLDSKGSNYISQRTLDLMNNSPLNDPLISIEFDNNDLGQTIATFYSAPNYYGSNHRIIFKATDPSFETVQDTIIVNVLPENDPPKIMELENAFVSENDSINLEFGSFTTDIDDTSLTFTIEAYRAKRQSGEILLDENDLPIIQDSISIVPNTFVSNNVGDSVLFIPEKLWSHKAIIQVIAFDGVSSDTSRFTLDVERVLRPHLTVALIQNTAFSRFLQVIVTDTASRATNISMEIQNQDIQIDTVAAHTYVSDLSFESSGNYSVDIFANASVGDTTINEYFALVAGKSASRWMGRSFDGNFRISGDPGAVNYDQSFLIADSTLFVDTFHDRASYIFGNEDILFNKPIEVRLRSKRNDLAIYRRKNGVVWEELPSILTDNEIFTLSEKAGYFKLGPKTLIVPEKTNIHQNYPNPFNPTTTISYDIGLMDGLSQNVSIDVFNLLGQHVKTLIKDLDQIGQYSVQWNGLDSYGQQMPSGVYFIQLKTKTGIIKNKKMMLLK